MSTNAHLETLVAGGNATLWTELLGPPAVWLAQLEVSYALVRWACLHQHPAAIRISWLPFFFISAALALLANRHWTRLRQSKTAGRGVERACFMAAISALNGALFSLLILIQGIATFIFDPCQY